MWSLRFQTLRDIWLRTFLAQETPRSIPIMAIVNRFTKTCWKKFQADRWNNQLFYVLRALHKSAASEALEIPASGEETVSDRLITPADVGEKMRIKNLKEMPGPSTLSNLIQFFWRDGFSRIHEIQVMVSSNTNVWLIALCFTWGNLFEFPSMVKSPSVARMSQFCHLYAKWHRLLRKSAPGAWPMVNFMLPFIGFVIVWDIGNTESVLFIRCRKKGGTKWELTRHLLTFKKITILYI